MKVTNREIIQSYLVTTAKYDFSVHEKRILYRLIEALQAELEGKKLDVTFENTRFNNDKKVSIPIKDLLNSEDDKNHASVKKAIRDLRNKTFEIEDDKEWKLIGIIEKPTIKKYDDRVVFELQEEIYTALFDFAKGYRKYELVTAMQFESVYAMRFYELFSNTKDKQTFSIDWLKERFGLVGKYARSANFIDRVIKPAKKELDAKSSFSFNYEPVKRGRKIHAIDFWPIEIQRNKDPELERKQLQQKTSPRWDLEVPTLDQLTHGYGFNMPEIKRNMNTFRAAAEIMDLPHFLASKKQDSESKRNPKGWIITALKEELKKAKGEN